MGATLSGIYAALEPQHRSFGNAALSPHAGIWPSADRRWVSTVRRGETSAIDSAGRHDARGLRGWPGGHTQVSRSSRCCGLEPA